MNDRTKAWNKKNIDFRLEVIQGHTFWQKWILSDYVVNQ